MYKYRPILGKRENNLTWIPHEPSGCSPVAKSHSPIPDNIYQ